MSDMTPSAMGEQPEQPPRLSAERARVLGCLIEKQLTTPEVYPLTQNALVTACNQKTSREPVMNLSAGEVGHALRQLQDQGLVKRVSGARAERWEQLTDKQLGLVNAQRALLGLLLLRGPQTLNELTSRGQRMHGIDDPEQIRHHLERLISRDLAVLVPRGAGRREDRYMHLLCGEVDISALQQSAPESSSRGGGHGSDARIEALEARVAALEARLARLDGEAADEQNG